DVITRNKIMTPRQFLRKLQSMEKGAFGYMSLVSDLLARGVELPPALVAVDDVLALAVVPRAMIDNKKRYWTISLEGVTL
ncbi:hypothetical protein KIPB_016228, partial [Kipferlia bialata]